MKSVLSRSTWHPAPSAKYTMCSCCTPASPNIRLTMHQIASAFVQSSRALHLASIVRYRKQTALPSPAATAAAPRCCPFRPIFGPFSTHHLITLHANCQAASATSLRTRQTHLLSCRAETLETMYNRCHEIDSTSLVYRSAGLHEHRFTVIRNRFLLP